jgi:hypothetical protein
LRPSHLAGVGHGLLAGLPRCLAHKFARKVILLVIDGAPNRCGALVLPDNIRLLYLPACSTELNPKEKSPGRRDEIREKIRKTSKTVPSNPWACAPNSREAVAYIERNPELVKSIASFPYIVKSL